MNDSSEQKRKQFHEIAKQFSMVAQLGLSLIMPTLLCILGCAYLCNRFNIGGWIYIPGFILGLGSSFMTAYKFYLFESKNSKKDKEKRKVGHNRHF